MFKDSTTHAGATAIPFGRKKGKNFKVNFSAKD